MDKVPLYPNGVSLQFVKARTTQQVAVPVCLVLTDFKLQHTVFDLITAHTPVSAQSSKIVDRLQISTARIRLPTSL